MLDLETLGTRHDAVVLSIGAVAFDADGLYEHTCYTVLDQHTQRFGRHHLRYGAPSAPPRSVDTATEMWWAEQDVGARAVFREEQMPVAQALAHLELYIAGATVGAQEVRVWGNGATFDNVILAHLFEWAGREVPWHWRHGRCFRTLRASLPRSALERAERSATLAFGGTVEKPRGWLTAHRADHDAIWQAEVCAGLLCWLRRAVTISTTEAKEAK
jgi:hypothetical protein